MKRHGAVIIALLLVSVVFADELAESAGEIIEDIKQAVLDLPAVPDTIIIEDPDPVLPAASVELNAGLDVDNNFKLKNFYEKDYYIKEDVIATYANYSITNSSGSFNVTVVNTTKIVKTVQEILKPIKKHQIELNGKIFIDIDNEIMCTQDGTKKNLICDSMLDGNGDGKCDPGETCCEIHGNGNLKNCAGHRSNAIKEKLRGSGIQ